MSLLGVDPDSEQKLVESHAAAILIAEMARDIRIIRKALTAKGT